jgi:hypothetical protein
MWFPWAAFQRRSPSATLHAARALGWTNGRPYRDSNATALHSRDPRTCHVLGMYLVLPFRRLSCIRSQPRSAIA